ncbi:hypothetical protein Tco_0833493 [Tanacetum coccineum]
MVTVVDSFIPTKRTKDGKRFGFVRFINVFNVERLVNNLCTIWVGRSKFHANVARFKREYMKGSVNVDKTKNESNKRKFDGSHKNVENTVIGKSFVSVVKTSRMPIDKESPPAIVLEDDCLNAKDLTLSLMGRVKEMASLVNLKKALCNEGLGLWFSVIKQAYAEFVSEGQTLEDLLVYHPLLNKKKNIGIGTKWKDYGENERDDNSFVNLEDVDIRWLNSEGSCAWDLDSCPEEVALNEIVHFVIVEFDKPSVNRACIDTPFPVSLSIDQKEDMERRISKEGVKRSVWDSGVDKSLAGRMGSGLLRINMCKSKIMGVNVEDEMVKNAASKLGCLVLKTPFYLFGTKVWGNIQGSKLRKKWWTRVISREFSLMARDPKSKQSFWYRVEQGLTPKDKGGLGSYGEDGNLNKDVSGGVRTCWTSIVHEVRVLQGRGINVADYIRLKLGNGENTRFWVDNWYEGGVIKELFPRMFALELNKNATVSSKLNASSLDNSFSKKSENWELRDCNLTLWLRFSKDYSRALREI